MWSVYCSYNSIGCSTDCGSYSGSSTIDIFREPPFRSCNDTKQQSSNGKQFVLTLLYSLIYALILLSHDIILPNFRRTSARSHQKLRIPNLPTLQIEIFSISQFGGLKFNSSDLYTSGTSTDNMTCDEANLMRIKNR